MSFFKELSSKIIIDNENNNYNCAMLSECLGDYFLHFL